MERRINRWLDSLDPECTRRASSTPTPETCLSFCQATDITSGRARKRRRYDKPDTDLVIDILPHTPPSTEVNGSCLDIAAEMPHEPDSPTSRSMAPPSHKRFKAAASSISSKATEANTEAMTEITNTNTTNKPAVQTSLSGLALLEKPVIVEPFPININIVRRKIGQDVFSLYEKILDTSASVGVVPAKLKEALDNVGEKTYSSNFRHDNNVADDLSANHPCADNRETDDPGVKLFPDICKIVERAAASLLLGRHEDGWNDLVHNPLLQLVFSCDHPTVKILSQEPPPAHPTVRLEPVRSAVIAKDSMPKYQFGGSGQQTAGGPSLARSAPSAPDAPQVRGPPSSANSQAPSNSPSSSSLQGSKKVDFVLLLDLPDGNFKRALAQLVNVAFDPTKTVPHLNQTVYPPVKDSLIAVAVETKARSPRTDPLIQLGVWTAAWHKRMYNLRFHLGLSDLSMAEGADAPSPIPHAAVISLSPSQSFSFPTPEIDSSPASQRPATTTRVVDRLSSLPLIQVIGHQWQLYLACDQKHSIFMYGPLELGSTKSVVSTYALVASLEAIKMWILDSFYPDMREWFGITRDFDP